MHGPIDLTNVSRILALDLGKFSSVLCIYDPRTHEHRFESLQTTPQVIHDLLVKHQTPDDPARTLVVMETCDVSGWIYDIAVALGMGVAIANCSHEAWRWSRVKRKTDKDDALKLAKLVALQQLPTVHMPSPQQRQRRRLVHYRRVLVERRTAIMNQVRSIYSQQGLSLPKKARCWTKAGIEQLTKEAKELSDTSVDELWRGRLHIELRLLAELSKQIDQLDQKLDDLASEDDRIKLLQSVPGVGPRLSETLVAHIDDPHRFRTAAQVASYAGLVPKQMDSGTVKRSGRITRRGPALLRSMLVEVAWMVYMRCDWAKRFVQRISGGVAARKKIAIVALARKLLVMLWAMLRDNRPFVDPAASPPEDTAPKLTVSSVAAVALG
jgi:transposase